jgi:hypothetical protein
MEIDIKTIGQLIDELIVLNIRIWNTLDIITCEKISANSNDKLIADAARKAQEYNARRTELIRAIDKRLGEGNNTLSEKTYGSS